MTRIILINTANFNLNVEEKKVNGFAFWPGKEQPGIDPKWLKFVIGRGIEKRF